MVPPCKVKDKAKFEPRWFLGTYFGQETNSNEILIGASRGVFKLRSIRRLVKEERFDKSILDDFTSTPQCHKNDGGVLPSVFHTSVNESINGSDDTSS